MMWVILIVWFIAWETIALLSKERYYPSLSRWVWRKTAWQVTVRWPRSTRWNYDVYFTCKPLRVILFIAMSWATIHLSFGECAFGLC